MARPLAKSACMWHAFHALSEAEADEVKKAKLKVLTHNIANTLGLAHTEKKLDNYDSETLSFPSYMGFINAEVFNNIQEPSGQNHTAQSILQKVDEVCWMLACQGYMKRSPIVLEPDNLFLLWKIFNTLSECDDEGYVVTPIIVDHEEVKLFASEFCRIVGTHFDASELDEISSQSPEFSFEQFTNYFEKHLCNIEKMDLATTGAALRELQDEIVYEVIKKGMLVKKGHMMTTLKERWFVLTPMMLRYYTGSDEKDLKGEISINPLCRVELLGEATRGTYRYRFKFTTPGKSFEIHAPDMKTRGEWQTAIKTAVDYCKKPKTPQEMVREERRQERRERRRLEREREMKRKQSLADMEKTRQELEEERLAKERAEAIAREQEEQRRLEEEKVARAKLEAEQTRQDYEQKLKDQQNETLKKQQSLEMETQLRIDAEQRLLEIGALRDEEKRQLAELWTLKQELERLLEEERQAKRDEEIVRQLQARVLREEEEKRLQLEEMQQKLEESLREEQQEREGLQETQRLQQDLLLQEKEQMLQLQERCRNIEQDLKDKSMKLAEAETAKIEMAEKLKKKERNKPPVVARLAAHLPDEGEWIQVTHRGPGAFCHEDFRKPSVSSQQSGSPPPSTSQGVESDSGRASDGSISPVFDQQDRTASRREGSEEGHTSAGLDRTSTHSDASSQHASSAGKQDEVSSARSSIAEQLEGSVEQLSHTHNVSQESHSGDEMPAEQVQ